VFAVGDARHGSIKRVASAVGDGSIAIRLIHDYLALLPPESKGHEPRLQGQGCWGNTDSSPKPSAVETVTADPLTDGLLGLEGHQLRAIEPGHTDTDGPSAPRGRNGGGRAYPGCRAAGLAASFIQ